MILRLLWQAFASPPRVVQPAIAVLLLALSLPGAMAQTREVKVGVYQNEPKIQLGPKGQPSGILGDLLQAIAQEEGWTLTPVVCAWQACLEALARGDIDLMPDMAYSTERASLFDFHQEPSLHSWSQLYQRPDIPVLHAMLDLANKRVAVLDGSVQQGYMKQLLTAFGVQATLVPVQTQHEAFEQVSSGQVDAAVANRFFGDLRADHFDLQSSTLMFQPSPLFYATGKGRHADLLAAIDRHLLRWKAQPGSPYQTVMTRWMGAPAPAPLSSTVRWGIGALLALLLLALAGAVLLRRQVAEKTRHLKASEDKLADILNNVDAYIYIKDLDGRYLYANRKVCTLFGRSPAQIVGRADDEFFDPASNAELRANDRRVLDHGERVETEDHLLALHDPHPFSCLSVKLPLRHANGKIYALCGISTDMSQQKASEAVVHQLVFYDPLTHLPNRRLLMMQLQQALDANRRHHRGGALLLVDVDHFKVINDTLGHDLGDLMLQKVALRLQESTRAEDLLARQGDDEFVLILPGLDATPSLAMHQAEQVARDILARLSEPYALNDTDYPGTVSIGIALFNETNRTREVLLKQADFAVSRAKAEGRNTLRFYDPVMQAEAGERTRLEQDLRRALAVDELVLYYQPQVDARGHWLGAEALVRWQHPTRGLVAPNEFIPVAEACGLILPLGQWVLHTACQQLAAWAEHPSTAGFYMAVNVSARELQHPDFVASVLATLKATGALPERLELEITESHLVHDVQSAIAKMTALRAHGVRFSLDDFGTGYSSLSMLKRLPLDQIKIDQSFVQDLLVDADNAAIVNTIVTLSRSLNLDVIAEGVETAEQRDALLALDCDRFQGDLYGRPAPLPPQALPEKI